MIGAAFLLTAAIAQTALPRVAPPARLSRPPLTGTFDCEIFDQRKQGWRLSGAITNYEVASNQERLTVSISGSDKLKLDGTYDGGINGDALAISNLSTRPAPDGRNAQLLLWGINRKDGNIIIKGYGNPARKLDDISLVGFCDINFARPTGAE